MYNAENECGTGAIVPWADKLWAITYGPHLPKGSTDKLYSISTDLRQTVHKESIGGTPANRMLHRESNQLFIGPYAISGSGSIRAMPYSQLYGRPTGNARHLEHPKTHIYMMTMEEGLYEIDVRSLTSKELYRDEQLPGGRKANLPGYHGKGLASSQGVVVYANNGEHGDEALVNPTIPSGCLAEWDGSDWKVIRRNQFTEVTTPGGILGNQTDSDPIWSIGWDHRSLILMCRQNDAWQAYRLPKTSHCYDGAHGWNTEWPRIRDIGERDLLMTMHGMLWRFPKSFSHTASAGIAPRSSTLKVIGDFCRWNGRVVFACDDTAKSEFLNKRRAKGGIAGPGQSHSNLWFVDAKQLNDIGPRSGRGAVWLNDTVQAGETSEPFIGSGFASRHVTICHTEAFPVTFDIEIDITGNGVFTHHTTLVAQVGRPFFIHNLPAVPWVRFVARTAARGVTIMFSYRDPDRRTLRPDRIFDGLARTREAAGKTLLYARGGDRRTLAVAPNALKAYELDANSDLKQTSEPALASFVQQSVPVKDSVDAGVLIRDDYSVRYVSDDGRRWIIPVQNPATPHYGRLCREVCTERDLLHICGTFIELPAENAGGITHARAIASHPFVIHDYASYRGMLVLTASTGAKPGAHVVTSTDANAAVWLGVVDDLWKLGRPVGKAKTGLNNRDAGIWTSDPILANGFGDIEITCQISGGLGGVVFVDADISGNNTWIGVCRIQVMPGSKGHAAIDKRLHPYWVRIRTAPGTDAIADFTFR